MFQDTRRWAVGQGDVLPVIYARRGWWIRPIRWGTSKIDDANIRGRIPATNDPATVAACCLQIPGCSWSLECGPRSGVIAADVEQRILKGEDGVLELRMLAGLLGIRESLIPVGLTPIYSTRSGGLRILYAHPGHYVASGLLQHCRWVEVKGDNSGVRLPPGGGYAWDVNSPFALKLMAPPDWFRVTASPATRSRETLLPEGALGDRPFTPLGHRSARRIIDRVLDSAASSHEACRSIYGLGRLCQEGRISPAYGQRIVERLAAEVSDFRESGFSRQGLLKRVTTAFERGCHHE